MGRGPSAENEPDGSTTPSIPKDPAADSGPSPPYGSPAGGVAGAPPGTPREAHNNTALWFDFTYNANPNGETINGHRVIVVVHTNGIHHIPVVLCACPGAKEATISHFLAAGLCPASFKEVKTVFTFDVLEDNLLSFLECHTTSLQYYQKLRRLTNPVAPHIVPVSL